MISQVLEQGIKAGKRAQKARGFTAPDGTFYEWTKPGRPTQEDIDAIVQFHETKVAPSKAAVQKAGKAAGALFERPTNKASYIGVPTPEGSKAAEKYGKYLDTEEGRIDEMLTLNPKMTREQAEDALDATKPAGFLGVFDAHALRNMQRAQRSMKEAIAPITDPVGAMAGKLGLGPLAGAYAVATKQDPIELGKAMVTGGVTEALTAPMVAVSGLAQAQSRHLPVTQRLGGLAEALAAALPVEEMTIKAGAKLIKGAKDLKGATKTGANAFDEALSTAEGSGIASGKPPKPKFEPKELEGYTSPKTLQEAGVKVNVKSKPGKPQASVPKKAEIEPPKGQGVTHADVDNLREEIGWQPREKTVKPDSDLIKDAKKHSGKEEIVAQRIIDEPKRTLTDDETLALGNRLRQLKNDMSAARAADDAEAFTIADDAAQKIAEALDQSGSRQGRNFRARQFVAVEEDAWNLQRKLQKKIDSGELNTKEAKRIESLIKDVEAKETTIAQLQKQVDELEAKTHGDVVITQLAKGRAKVGYRSKEALKAEREEILTEFSKLGARLSANPIDVVAEAAPLLKRLATNIIEDGARTLSEVAEKIRALGVDVADHEVYKALTHKDPVTKKPNEAAKRVAELKKQADLILQINEVIGGGVPKKGSRPPAPSETIAGLRKALDDVKKITGTPTERSQAKQLQQSIEEVLEEIKTGQKPTRETSPTILDAESKSLKVKLDKIRAQLKEIRAKRDIEAEIADLQRQLETGELKGPQTKQQKALTRQLENLKAERDLLRGEVSGRITQPSQNAVINLINAPKTLKSSVDISAAGRQGWFLGLANPDKVPAAFWDQLKAMASPKGAIRVQNDILKRENAALYKRGKLYLGAMDGTVNHAEEAFSARLFPGWRKLNPFRASERAYTAYLNRIRADVFDRMVKWHGGDLSNEQLEIIGNFVNVASGRGGASVPGLDKAAEALNLAFFSPRFVASRFELLAAQPLTRSLGAKGVSKARRIVARQYAQMLGMLGGVYMLVKGAGGEVSADRASADFGKIKIGNTRIDPLAGVQQAIVLGHRLLTGEYTTTKGEKIDLNDPKYGGMTKGDVAMRFLRSKLSPTAGAAYSLMEGKNFIGEEYDWKNAARDLTLPISLQELVEGAMEDGWNKDDFLGLLNFIGFSTSTYKDKEKKPDPRN
jgi:hypothetical protein